MPSPQLATLGVVIHNPPPVSDCPKGHVVHAGGLAAPLAQTTFTVTLALPVPPELVQLKVYIELVKRVTVVAPGDVLGPDQSLLAVQLIVSLVVDQVSTDDPPGGTAVCDALMVTIGAVEMTIE